VTDTSLAALLLTNRIVDVGAKPLSAGEFWELQRKVPDLDVLMGASADDLRDRVGPDEADRVTALLEAGTAFAFERERLQEEGVLLVSALDDHFPGRLRSMLGDACPAFLLVAGPIDFLALPMVGVVGSRDASPAAMEVAGEVARAAAAQRRAVVSGLARGIDQAAMMAALQAGAPVVGVPSEGVRVAARNAEVRSRVHAGELCIASPYGPGVRFTAGTAMGRNKVVYALADATLVVCSDHGKGGTWEGAREAMRRGFGRVAVWTGDGEGPGNAALVKQGASAVGSVEALFDLGDKPLPAAAAAAASVAAQVSLFD
jgi:predicted Rossmann fold nucleotide-binding protein DprA/Smf involved in DNA uptake